MTKVQINEKVIAAFKRHAMKEYQSVEREMEKGERDRSEQIGYQTRLTLMPSSYAFYARMAE
jgi:hypothetical protein